MTEEKIKIYNELCASSTKFERKGKTMPYTSANGYMFSLLNKEDEIGIRLSKESQASFKEKYNATIFKSHGAVMRDYVKIPDELLHSDRKLIENLLDESFEFVMSLPPKPTTKKAKKK